MKDHRSSLSHSTFSGRIGVARADITPPVGIYTREWGAAVHCVAESIHRPLTLNVLTLQSQRGDAPLVLVEADLGFWRNRGRFEQMRLNLRQRFSLDSPRFLFGMSHTHASVTLADPNLDWPGGELLGPFLERLDQAAHEAIQTALENAEESVLDWHYGRCALASNRDLPDPTQDSGRFVCGFNPNLKADDTLLVGRISSRSGKTVATLVNYACHPTTLAWENRSISPDFVGAMRDTIEAATGGLCLFLQGASGDLAPRYQYVGDPQVADQHGRNLAYACLATLEDMNPPGMELAFDRVFESGAPLAIWRYAAGTPSTALQAREIDVMLPIKDWPTAAELERERLAAANPVLDERLRRRRDTRLALGDGDACSLSLWVWRIGKAVLVGIPEEAYSILQKELRQRFPEISVACVTLVNNRIGGYLPPRELYGHDIYQVWRTPFAAGSLEIVLAALTESIQQILDGAHEC
jgi:hypothetical protein